MADVININMREAKSSLSRLVRELEAGTSREFIIARNGRPAARLLPLETVPLDHNRRIGVAKGRFKVPRDIDRAEALIQELFETL